MSTSIKPTNDLANIDYWQSLNRKSLKKPIEVFHVAATEHEADARI
jgi:hypothetical protein